MDCFCAAAPKVMKSYKLVYFDARGVAETCRCLFAAAQQPYEDIRLSLTFGKPGDFSTISRPEFDEMKSKGELDISLGKVPLLEVDAGLSESWSDSSKDPYYGASMKNLPCFSP